VADAVRAIRPGRRILIGSGAAEPISLVEALCTHGGHLADNEIIHILTLGPAPYVDPGMKGRFRHTAFFIGPNVRDAVQDGRVDFTPVFLSEIPQLIRSRRVRIDVALIQVSPADDMRRMKDVAQARGLAGFSADVQISNAPGLAILHESGLKVSSRLVDSVFHVTAYFEG
jgi:acyl-CoA hydrolase